MPLVTVFNTFSPLEAQLICSRLDAAGLMAVVTHETAALTTEGYALTVGGIQVQVPDSQLESAREILASKNDGQA